MTLLARLRTAFPTDQLVTNEETLRSYSHDHASPGNVPLPAALLFANSTDDVAAAVRIAYDLGVPVVTQGARTGLTRGANAVAGALLINLERMKEITDISPINQTATVQAGVVLHDISEAARPHGLFFPPDPGSVYQATFEIGRASC